MGRGESILSDLTSVRWTAFDDGEIYAGGQRIGAMTTLALAVEAVNSHNAVLAAAEAEKRAARSGVRRMTGLTGVQIGDGGTQNNSFS
jgi:hypothetical protein